MHRRYTFLLTGLQALVALVAGRLCFVTLDLFLAASNASLVLAESRWRRWLLECTYFLGKGFRGFRNLSLLSFRLLARLCRSTGTIALVFPFH